MVFVTSIISSQEWIRLSEAAQQAFPNEVLARGGRDHAPVLIERCCGVAGSE
jgi:hypothetical protein